MSPILSFIAGLGAWNWFIAASLLMLLETVVPGVHFLWFGLSAAVVGGLVMLIGLTEWGDMLNWQMQIIVFALVAVAMVFWVRSRFATDTTQSDQPDLNVRGAQYIGRTFVVIEAIRDGRGKIKVGDTLWVAAGPDAALGAHVRVTGVEGTTLTVERVGT